MSKRRVFILAVVCVLVCVLITILQIRMENSTPAQQRLAGEPAGSTAERVILRDRPVGVPSAAVLGINDPGIFGYDD